MSHIRLKVQVNEKQSGNSSYRKTPVVPLKFIYIFDPSSTTTINDLRCSLEQYIIRQFAKKNIRIVQLLTDDGYFLPENGVCQQVLQDNERIVCVDMDTFVEENSSTLICENSFCEIKKHDVSDDREKYIEVGLDKTGKLFIRMNGAWKMYGLYLFNVFQLIRIAAEQSPSKFQFSSISTTNNIHTYLFRYSYWSIEWSRLVYRSEMGVSFNIEKYFISYL